MSAKPMSVRSFICFNEAAAICDGIPPIRQGLSAPGGRASMKPPQFATEYGRRTIRNAELLQASMKPPQFATEYDLGIAVFPAPLGRASMKPPQFATEYVPTPAHTATASRRFNEAAAICDGIPFWIERSARQRIRFNEAAAICDGILCDTAPSK